MTDWFKLAGGKAHLLIDGDPERFPFGRALCAPFDRRPHDALLVTNDVGAENFCCFCVVANSNKKKKG